MHITKLLKPTLTALGLASLGLLLLLPGKTSAANPATINFQGKVVNSDGTNVTNGTYGFIFRIYNTASPTTTTSCTSTATCLWEETQSSVTVTNGVFQVELGSACALTSSSCNNSTGGPINWSSSSSLYLTMKFNGDSAGFMTPTIHITSVPFALQADNSSTLGGLAAGNFVQLAQGVQNDSSTTNASIFINKNNSSGTPNILELQKSSADVLVLTNGGLLTLQPAASLTSGQTADSLTFTNGSSTGGTVQGYSQTITVSNTSSASTTNGINISMSDSTALANTNQGINISLSGSNSSQTQLGINLSVNHGVGISSITSGAGATNVTCGANSFQIVGICGADTSGGTIGLGIYGESSSTGNGNAASLNAAGVGSGSGIEGYGTSGTTTNTVLINGLRGVANAYGGTGSYTSIGVLGSSKAGSATATTYGGYFALDPGSSTSIGAALYATNSTVAANILQLQNNNVNALVVNSSGTTVLGQSNTGGLNGTITFNNAAGTGTASITLAANPSTNYTYQLPTGTVGSNQCLQSGTVATGTVPLTFAACSAGGGDNGFVNSVAVTDFNLQDVAASTSVTGTTWTASGSGPTNVTLAISNASATTIGSVTTSAQTFAGVKTFQDFMILQPAASMTAGQTALTQTLTNASSTGGTVQGYSQTITVSNTVSASNTSGFNIAINDTATTLGNTDTGLKISLGASSTNTSRIEVGVDSSVTQGIGIRGVSSGGAGSNVTCASTTGVLAVGVCADNTSTTVNTGIGLYARTLSPSNSALNSITLGSAGVLGYSNASTSTGQFGIGIKGLANTGATVGTLIGTQGVASAGAGATTYGGYFALSSASSATAGAALYATNSTVGANIFQLQDNATSVFTVGDGGLITLQPADGSGNPNLTAGQTEISQSFTNTDTTAGTVNGYKQTITVSNASGTSTTNGINISLTDNAPALSNINTGIKVALNSGSNTSQLQLGADISVTRGLGLKVVSTGAAGTGWSCGNAGGSNPGAICAADTSNTTTGFGIFGQTNSNSASLTTAGSFAGSGVIGYNYSNTTGALNLLGVRGTVDATGATGAYTAVGTFGVAKAASSSAKTYGGYFTLDSGSSTTLGSALYATNSTVGANIFQLQDNTTSVFTVGDGGLITLQPADGSGNPNLVSGQTEIAQSFTNASSTGGTVNGYSQTITVSNTTSVSTTNGINISLTDSTALANTNQGINISLGGSNTNQLQVGINVSTAGGIGVKAVSSVSAANVTCGSISTTRAGVCGGGSTGIFGYSTTGSSASISSNNGAGIYGENTQTGAAPNFYKGVAGETTQTASAAYTSVGVYGSANGGSTATIYGGYFTIGTGGATLGSALYATNSTVAANILDLQDGTGSLTSVFTVGDGGVTTAKSNNSLGFQVQDSSNSKSLFIVDTSGDQVVLGMQGTTGVNGKIVFNTSNASNTSVALISSSSTASSYSIVLPTATSGGTNYCLVGTNASGTTSTSWVPCGAGSTATATLTPEFAGAVMTGDGTSNVGTMTSDFCSNTVGSLPAITTGCNSGETHNFYQWTANATNDYEIFVKWAVPSDFSTFSSFTFNGFRTSVSDAVTVTVYNAAGTSCGTASIAGTVNTWNDNTALTTSCTPSPGNVMTLDVHLSVGVSSEFARIGEVTITYNRN